nr:NAD(P)H-dependent oxidoreductase [Tetragenococcus muriaticus]
MFQFPFYWYSAPALLKKLVRRSYCSWLGFWYKWR